MKDFLSKLANASTKKVIEPREIFMSLPQRAKEYAYPRDVQTEVWKKWFENRNQKNNIIKMNTGSGKTVVGLTILQSCLNEGKGPAVYVVPDKYLVKQVLNESHKLGINATVDSDDYHYLDNKSIFITNIHKIVNGHSVFGMRNTDNYPIGSIIIDDVHTCMNKILDQYTLRIPTSHELYNKLIALFLDDWKSYNQKTYIDIVENKEPGKDMLIPFWIWKNKQQDIYRLLKKYNNDSEANKDIFFTLPLIEQALSICNCVIDNQAIEIVPMGVDIKRISSLENATRRIFMSATLSDDSVFVNALGLTEKDIGHIITPENANDIGDRLILFPKCLNHSIPDDAIKNKIMDISRKYNVVVITPSRSRAIFWDETGHSIVDKENIDDVIHRLKIGHVGLVILANRYDGIDLPNDACRMLVIDGVPPLTQAYTRYEHSVNPSNKTIIRERIQRIEQGMGRGIRSNDDSCCVVLMGDTLADILLRGDGISFFSRATIEQYELSKELWSILKEENDNPSLDDIFQLAKYSLERNPQWIAESKKRLAPIKYDSHPRVDSFSIAMRRAFESALSNQWNKSIDFLNHEANATDDEKAKAYIFQLKATYMNFIDSLEAQRILETAKSLNRAVMSPMEGMHYQRVKKCLSQANQIKHLDELDVSDLNNHLIHIDALLSDLSFSSEAKTFEHALEEIGRLLGFSSSRPDNETNGYGPDNLWAYENENYFVIECKNQSQTKTISKDYCNQLSGSVHWLHENYGKEIHCFPIIIHCSNIADKAASPNPDMRVITKDLLDNLKKNIRSFNEALVQNSNWKNDFKIASLLKMYHLNGKDIITNYTVKYKKDT